MGILTWLEYLPAFSARERQGRGTAEWQNVKRSIEKHLDNNEEKSKDVILANVSHQTKGIKWKTLL